MLHRNLLLLIFTIALLFVSVSLAQDKAIAPLVANELLQEAGLEQVWQTKLAVRDSEQIEKLSLLGDKICALTSTNYLFCLNRNNGNLILGVQLAPMGFPVLDPRLYENQLLVVAGNKLMQIDLSQSAPASTFKFNYTVVYPAVRNKANLYTIGADKRVHAISAAEKLPVFEVTADNGSMPTGLFAADEYVVFTTGQGNVICVSATSPQLLWQFDTTGPITAAPVRDNNDLYVASEDTKVYKLTTAKGKQVWKCQLGGILKTSPRVAQTAVYQYAQSRGISAINKDSGKLLWTVDEGIDLLAEANGKAYIMTNNRMVAVVDNTTHKQLFSINFAQAALEAPNTVDGKIYVSDRMGRVACIAVAK